MSDDLDDDLEITIFEINPNNRDDLIKQAMMMYLGETCPYCLVKFETLEDLDTAVYNGYTKHGRVAHLACFKKAQGISNV